MSIRHADNYETFSNFFPAGCRSIASHLTQISVEPLNTPCEIGNHTPHLHCIEYFISFPFVISTCYTHPLTFWVTTRRVLTKNIEGVRVDHVSYTFAKYSDFPQFEKFFRFAAVPNHITSNPIYHSYRSHHSIPGLKGLDIFRGYRVLLPRTHIQHTYNHHLSIGHLACRRVVLRAIKQPHLRQRLPVKKGHCLQIAIRSSINSWSDLGCLGLNRSRNSTSPLSFIYLV